MTRAASSRREPYWLSRSQPPSRLAARDDFERAGEVGQLVLGFVPDAVPLVEPPQLARGDQPGQALVERVAQGLVVVPDVDHVIAVRLRRPGELEAGEPVAVEAGRGQVLERGVDLAVLHGGHRVGRAVEPDDLDVRPALLARRRCRPPSRPARRPSSGRRRAEAASGRPRSGSDCRGDHQLELVDVVGPGRQVVARPRSRSTRSR